MLKQLLGRGKITAHVVDIDKYKRKVAVMYAGGGSVSVNETMVRLGGAWHFRRFSPTCAAHVSPAKFNAAENYAKKKKLGIWRR